MDFPVEATVNLTHFQNERKVRRLLHSHHFKLTELDRGQVLVEGSFQRLKDVKARLQELLETTPDSSSDPTVSSGAILNYYIRNNNGEGTGRAPDSSPFSGSLRRPSDDQTADEPIVIDSDVYRYAWRFRKRELDDLLTRQDVQLCVKEVKESTIITLQGRSSGMVLSKLQTLLVDLSKSLRTQEVLKTDLSSEGEALLRKIQKRHYTLASVLVRDAPDRLYLIGPSRESYDLKQSLQGEPIDQSGGRGRTTAPTSRCRSSLMARMNQRSSAERKGKAAAGFSSSKNDGHEAAAAGRSRPPRGRSQSESCERQREERHKNQVLTASVEPCNRGGFFSSLTKPLRRFIRNKRKKKEKITNFY
ncbi:hypothetical protein ILYODFUR_029778 [Ilyodon furcidens]|uniref:Uncharacterized protein n=1 Tax=Ilyodon furcidens TaxID=33524 RepID=A0ABV0UME7_9TELE